ncbi:uncharacterized protein [Rutidosis leptorrhynchoides]|uniref:uncharacterized protein isoform X1 n=1 Tax=Rutidosis leptorrhynchoides TaxID=125765 RepID=UPI003A98F3FA
MVPDEMSPEAADLIDQLLTEDPNQRLGARGTIEVKQHPFFRDINWDTLAWQKVRATNWCMCSISNPILIWNELIQIVFRSTFPPIFAQNSDVILNPHSSKSYESASRTKDRRVTR